MIEQIDPNVQRVCDRHKQRAAHGMKNALLEATTPKNLDDGSATHIPPARIWENKT